MNKLLYLFCIPIFLFSCTASKKTSNTTGAVKESSYKNLLSTLNNSYPDYKSMASDIKLAADINGTSYRATGLVRHVHRQGIFISVKKLGFEIGQVLLTPDSFFVLNRWDKEYIKEPISIVEDEFQVKGEYGMVEELLTGIPRTTGYKKNDKSSIENGTHRAVVPSIYKDIDIILWLEDQHHEVVQAYYQDFSERGVRMKYSNERRNKLVIERELHTENIDDNDLHIKLEYKNPTFDKAKLPTFNIPSHYSRRRM